MSNIQNLAGYKFQKLCPEKIQANKEHLKNTARCLAVKGSILLSHEGCNMFIAGSKAQNSSLISELYNIFPELSEIKFKVSWSDSAPFTRMLVKHKKEIITMGQPSIDATSETAPEIEPKDFANNYKDYIVVDTRNSYETSLGKFQDALDLGIESFRDFPNAIKKALPPAETDKPIVIYCTGGIRCEKAGLWMSKAGYKNVFQLKDGILGYFEDCGNQNYDGECFVFDKRVGLDHQLSETETKQCYDCRTPWTDSEINKREGVCTCGNTVYWYKQ